MSIKHEHIDLVSESIKNKQHQLENIEYYLNIPDTVTKKIDLKVLGRESIELWDDDIFIVVAESAKKVLLADVKKLLKVKAAIIKIDDD